MKNRKEMNNKILIISGIFLLLLVSGIFLIIINKNQQEIRELKAEKFELKENLINYCNELNVARNMINETLTMLSEVGYPDATKLIKEGTINCDWWVLY